jgi:hypothetical protein
VRLLTFSDRRAAERLVQMADAADVVRGRGLIHQCWGREAAIGTTPVVNAGPEGRLLEI